MVSDYSQTNFYDEFDGLNPERRRLTRKRWRRWGPYLSERQWGTVREDYSHDGNYWEYFSYDAARSRAYRWGEDGIAGISDDRQYLCLSLALWNEQDPFLKERLFGLTNAEAHHGEDVKECYYYLDATPSHSYLKMLYKYPQQAFPYDLLREVNAQRSPQEPEYELIDTGIFDDNRYFDVYVEYAKSAPDDILMQVEIVNRGPETATIHVVPQFWFRNRWTWNQDVIRPVIYVASDGALVARHPDMEDMHLYADGNPELLFCENETHSERIHGFEEAAGYFKDGFHDYIVHGNERAVNPRKTGSKSAAHYVVSVPGLEKRQIKLRLTNTPSQSPFVSFENVLSRRRQDADDFYNPIQEHIPDDELRAIQRQAFAGMIWSKQFYFYDVRDWLVGDSTQPPPPVERKTGRNINWQHLSNADIITMPDKWEFPWYATWDLAFHCIPFALIDPEFAKGQLIMLTTERYMHPSGQLPAYEGGLGDVNPPVHAWATWRVYRMDKEANGGVGDVVFLERVFLKLMINFTWWVNQKDAHGLNVFQGGFLGLDNIGIFDRGSPLPKGGHIDQADGTSWMAMYCLDMMHIAIELAQRNPVYEESAIKFFQHFLHIARAMYNMGEKGVGMWDEDDCFYYDVLYSTDDEPVALKIRSIVGLIPLFAVETIEPEVFQCLPDFARRAEELLRRRPDLASLVSQWDEPGRGRRHLLALVQGPRIKSILKRMLDEDEFLSEYGIRAMSRYHLDSPYEFEHDGTPLSVGYQPGESESDHFGGNSNWRGPIWFPINFMIIESLREFHRFYGDDFKVECPTGSNHFMSLLGVAEELSRRLERIFLTNDQGQRPVFGEHEKMQNDPHFNHHILFHEYFHGDNGSGLGASHQTGWTGLIANLLQAQRNGD
jgi:hypothetical protein